MTEKRFRVFAYNDGSGKYGVSDDTAEYTVAYFDNNFEAEHLCELLNALHEEKTRLYEDNIRIKQLITTAFNNERTELGSNVLKQLIEQL